MIAFMVIFAMGIGIQVGLLLSVPFEEWSRTAADWVVRHYFGAEKGD
jgi:hypothetical protein